MKLFKSLIAAICAMAFLASTALAEQAACCKKAAADGKTCSHKCCVAAAKDGKECEKCGGKGEIKKAEKSEKKEDKK
jgi:hypothetical protein